MKLASISKIVAAIIVPLLTINAQESIPVLEWSQEYKARDAKFDRILGVGEKGFYTYRAPQMSLLSNNRDEYFAYYDREMLQEQWLMQNPKWEFEEKRVDYKLSVNVEDVQYIFYESYNNVEDTRTLLVRTLGSDAVMSEPKVLEQLESKRRSKGNFRVVFSKDKKTFGVFTNPPYERKSAENFYVRVFNLELEELWNADIELGYRDDEFIIRDFDISNAGDVYVLSSVDENPRALLPKNMGRTYSLLKLDGETVDAKVTEYELDLQGVSVHNIGIRCDLEDGMMGISGFYGENNYYDMDGAVYLSFDQTSGEVTSSNLSKFSSDFVAQFNRGRARRGKGIRRNFVFRSFTERPGGGAYVIAEDYEVVVRTVQSGKTTTTNYYYYYRDIVVLSINPNGEIDWYAHIPKKQTSVNDGGYFLGYIMLQNEDGLHFLYNDHKKNAKRWGNKTLKYYNKSRTGNLAMVTLSHDANLTYNVMQSGRRQKFRAVPRSSRVSNDGKDGGVVLSRRGSKVKFGNLYFED